MGKLLITSINLVNAMLPGGAFSRLDSTFFYNAIKKSNIY